MDSQHRHTFTIDLQTPDSVVAQRALAGQPILIYPKGTHHRFDPWRGEVRTWTVDETTVTQIVDNFANRQTRGIRQSRLPVNEDHQGSRALGWFKDVVAMPEGVGGTFRWNRKGREALENGEFSYFSVEIYDEVVDRVTAEKVQHQIAGGALTNYPFFGEATSLMSRNAVTGGYCMPETIEQLQAERNGLLALFGRLFGRTDPPGPDVSTPDDAALPPAFQQQFTRMEEQLQQFTAQLTTLTGERDTYAQRVQALEGQLTTVQDARAAERFAVLAESYGHLPAATSDLAAHLRWLHEVDAEGAHREFFTGLLHRANDTFGRYFREQGVQRGQANSPTQQVETQAQAYMTEHPGVSYRDAVSAVMAANPTLEASLNATGGD